MQQNLIIVSITAFNNGTNIYQMQLANNIDVKKMQSALRTNFNIRMPMPDAGNKALITVNETLLYRDVEFVVEAFKKSVA